MPSPAENAILLWVLAAVFATLPVAIAIRLAIPRRVGEHKETAPSDPPGTGPAVPPPLPDFHPYTPPLAELTYVPGPLPQTQTWAKPDAIFAIILALIVAVLMGPGISAAVRVEPQPESAEKISLTPELWLVQILFQFGFVGLILLYLRARRLSIRSIFGLQGLSFWKSVRTALLWLIPAYIVIVTVTSVALPRLEQLTGIEMKQQMLVERSKEVTDSTSRALMFVTLCIGAPLLEEVIFRGVLYSVAAKFLHPVYANVATSVFFGVIHNNLLSLIPLTLLGIAFAAAFQRTRSLAVPVLMHSIFNGVMFVALMYGPLPSQ